MAGIIAKKWKTRQTETMNKKADEFFQKYWKTNERTNSMSNITYEIDENNNLVETVVIDSETMNELHRMDEEYRKIERFDKICRFMVVILTVVLIIIMIYGMMI
ncbi:MAG: hypothetical protein J6U54_07770 [Clostridiales bacterium]|nr:hypothetical protein [Clostridiales bacterium]